MNNIKELIRDLDWRKPEEVQITAMKKLECLDDLNLALLAHQSNDLCHKYCWENAAKVLKNIGYPRIKSVLPYLMEWFQDINWPGVMTIVEILRNIEPLELLPFIEDAAHKAILDKDETWDFGIVYLINAIGLMRLIKVDIYSRLVLLSNW